MKSVIYSLDFNPFQYLDLQELKSSNRKRDDEYWKLLLYLYQTTI